MARYPYCLRCRDGVAHDFAHGQSGYTYHRCRCAACRRAAAGTRRAWRLADPENATADVRTSYEYRQRNLAKRKAQQRQYHAQNAPYRRGEMRKYHRRLKAAVPSPRTGAYTRAEDAVAVRDDISLMEIAFLLRRSYHSVRHRRQALKGKCAA